MIMQNFTDFEIIDFIENRIEFTRGEEQKEWVNKYDIFTNRNLFEKYNQTEKLKEVENIRIELSEIMRWDRWGLQ